MIEFNSSKDVISKHKILFDRIAGRNEIDTFVLSGGRSSFKSYDICLAIIVDVLQHAGKGLQSNAVIFMQKREEIRDGVFKQFESVIDDLGLSSKFTFKVSPFEIELTATGSVIKFYGLNKQQGKKANAIDNISWIWFEEFDQFDSQESVEPTLDTFMRHNIKGERIKTVYSFNPPRSRHHWVFNYLKKLNAKEIHTTYLDDDTDKKLLPQQLIDRIERTKDLDPSWYSWNYLGIVPKDVESDFPSILEADSELQLTDDDYIFMGIDSATKGKDSTVACVVAFNKATSEIKLISFTKFDDVWVDGYTSQIIGNDIMNFARSVNTNAVYIDPMQGQHIIDYLIINAPEIATKAVNFGSKTSDRAKGKAQLAVNRRAEMYVNVSDQLKAKRVVSYIDHTELENQLNATEFIVDSKKIQVISKDIIKQRIGKSPDEADSFALAVQAVHDYMMR